MPQDSTAIAIENTMTCPAVLRWNQRAMRCVACEPHGGRQVSPQIALYLHVDVRVPLTPLPACQPPVHCLYGRVESSLFARVETLTQVRILVLPRSPGLPTTISASSDPRDRLEEQRLRLPQWTVQLPNREDQLPTSPATNGHIRVCGTGLATRDGIRCSYSFPRTWLWRTHTQRACLSPPGDCTRKVKSRFLLHHGSRSRGTIRETDSYARQAPQWMAAA